MSEFSKVLARRQIDRHIKQNENSLLSTYAKWLGLSAVAIVAAAVPPLAPVLGPLATVFAVTTGLEAAEKFAGRRTLFAAADELAQSGTLASFAEDARDRAAGNKPLHGIALVATGALIATAAASFFFPVVSALALGTAAGGIVTAASVMATGMYAWRRGEEDVANKLLGDVRNLELASDITAPPAPSDFLTRSIGKLFDRFSRRPQPALAPVPVPVPKAPQFRS